MLMRTDPLRELDRLTQQVFGMTAGRVAVPNICWVSRSSSRKGSVRINMLISPH